MSDPRGYAAREGWQQGEVELPDQGRHGPRQGGPIAPPRRPGQPVPPPVVRSPPPAFPPPVPGSVPVVGPAGGPPPPRASHDYPPLPDVLPSDPIALAQWQVRLLADVRELLLRQVQVGIVTPLTVVLTSVSTNVQAQAPYYFEPALFSLSLVNDGAGDIQYQIPQGSRGIWVDLKSTEQIAFTFQEARVSAIGLRLKNPTGSATVRVVGFY